MDILFLADNFPPEKNAQASRVYERACYWVKWGHRVTVITCAPNFPEGKVYPGYKNRWYNVEDVSGIRVVRVKTFVAPNSGTVLRVIDFLSYMFTAFVAGLFQRRPDLVAATSPQFFAAVAGLSLAVARRVPFVLELSDLWPDSIVAVGAMRQNLMLRWLEKLELFLYRRSSAVVALTGAFKDNLVRRGISPAKIFVVMNGVDLDKYKPRPRDLTLAAKWGISCEDFVIAYVGTLGMAHGLENLLDCAGLIDRPQVRFLLVGPGAEREMLMAEARRRGLQNVIFVPPQPKELMPSFWSLADVALVHLKDSALFKTVIPSKIFEAMGMGLPILLVAPEGEASKIVLGERAGMWVRAADPNALSAAVTLLDINREDRFNLAANSLSASSRHTRERQAREMLIGFESVLAGIGR